MPSTPDVKNELVRVVSHQVGERMSELATILRLAGGLHTISGRIALEAELHTPAIVQRVRKDLAELYGVRSDAKQMPAASTRPGSPSSSCVGLTAKHLRGNLGWSIRSVAQFEDYRIA